MRGEQQLQLDEVGITACDIMLRRRTGTLIIPD